MKRLKIYVLGIMFLSLLMFGLSGCGNGEVKETAGADLKAIPEGELDPAVWGKTYPDQYASYLKNNEGGQTQFGGSEKVSKYLTQPLLPELFKGYGFAKEYNEDRGHTYALQDIREIKRITPKSTGSCMTCKTPSAPGLIKEMGLKYYSTPFSEISKQVKHSIACADCHDPKTMELKVTRPAFIQAMQRRGVDVSKASRQDMRSYVCGQCHVEYYFKKDTKEVAFPWDKGFSPDEIESYYRQVTPGFQDWEHPDSKAPMLKAQHPEFETWQSGTHGSAGVACADCHMPYEKVGKNKISSHQWTSPLKTLERSCGACHRNGSDWLKARVTFIQTKTFDLLLKAETASNAAHKAVAKAIATPGADPNLVKQAQDLVVRGQWQWDFVAAENSTGFHNPELALETLGKSIDLSRQAELLAAQAIVKK